MALPTYIYLFAFYVFIKNIIYCVTRNKVAWNERLSPVKHKNIIQDKKIIMVSNIK